MTSFSGAVILPEQQKTLLFKNRDLIGTNHRDEVFYDMDAFGIRGRNPVNGEVTGLAIGVNRHGLAVANTHVRSTDDPSYHVLTEQILMFAKDAEDGLSMTADILKAGRKYQWGNLILADHDSILAIEIAGDQHSIEWSERKVLRTSHHIMLDTEDELRKYHTQGSSTSFEDSSRRVERGYELLRSVNNAGDVFSLLKDHGESPGQASICKHALAPDQYQTAMSYVIEVDHKQDTAKPKVLFHVARGTPCRSSYSAIPLIFPADEDIIRKATDMYQSALG
ncbi:MAG: hypothetical protein HXY34_09285 [Candidatus Thorarchaeota archaeon]|nr:hypothetical protein [Candidatus Thorarchaeota archaeon]